MCYKEKLWGTKKKKTTLEAPNTAGTNHCQSWNMYSVLKVEMGEDLKVMLMDDQTDKRKEVSVNLSF